MYSAQIVYLKEVATSLHGLIWECQVLHSQPVSTDIIAHFLYVFRHLPPGELTTLS